MKRTPSALTLALVLLLFLIVTMPSFQVVNATSETYELIPEAYQGMHLVDLRKGDHIEGSFIVTNLGPYKNLLDGTMGTFWVSVKCILEPMDRSEQIIFDYKGTSGGSFNYTAPYAGVVEISTFCSGASFFLNAKYPVLTIDYEIEAKPIELINPDLMAWWKLDEGEGTVVTDSSGNNYEGIIHGASWINDQGNTSLNFNGVSDYVSLPSLDLTNLDSMTAVVWIKSDLTEVGVIMYQGDGGEFVIANGDLNEDNQVILNPTYARFSVSLLDYHWHSVRSFSPMKPNVWHQIACAWEKGVSLRVYVDGVLAGINGRIPEERLYNPGGSFPSSLGIYSQSQLNRPDFFKGQISNVTVFNKALTTQEINALYGVAPVQTPELEPFPTALIISSIVIVVVIGIGLTVYFKKRKH